MELFNILLKEWEKDFIFNHFHNFNDRFVAMAEHVLRNAIATNRYEEYRASKALLLTFAPANIKERISRI